MQREKLAQEIWRRLSGITGVVRVYRDPDKPPAAEDMPCAAFFELEDPVLEFRKRNDSPAYKRELTVVIEVWTKGTSDADAPKVLTTFLKQMKAAIYEGGPTLSGLGEIVEVESGRVMRPGIGDYIAGIGTVFKIRYVENTAGYTK